LEERIPRVAIIQPLLFVAGIMMEIVLFIENIVIDRSMPGERAQSTNKYTAPNLVLWVRQRWSSPFGRVR
jgi:hypothetical protein